MKNLVVGLLTNRFGIVLAALNVCYFVSRGFVRNVFEHIHGEKYVFEQIIVEKRFFSDHFILSLPAMRFTVMELINVPALLLSLFSSKFINLFFSAECFFTRAKFEIAFILFFVTLQWLFIGWLAKTIALKIQAIRS
jgi:hypothetical protein